MSVLWDKINDNVRKYVLQDKIDVNGRKQHDFCVCHYISWLDTLKNWQDRNFAFFKEKNTRQEIYFSHYTIPKVTGYTRLECNLTSLCTSISFTIFTMLVNKHQVSLQMVFFSKSFISGNNANFTNTKPYPWKVNLVYTSLLNFSQNPYVGELPCLMN